MDLTINQKLNYSVENVLATKKAVNKKDIASKLGVSPSYFTEILKERIKLSAEFIQKYCIEFDVNPLYFFDSTNDTPPYKEIKPVKILVNEHEPPYVKADKVTATVTPTVTPTQKTLLPQVVTVDSGGNDNVVLVKVKARAGYLDGYGDIEYIQKLPAYSFPGFKNGTFRAFEVDGDSMEPTLETKEIVICQWVEKLDYIREDRVHVLVTKEGILIKRLLNCISKYGYIIGKSDAFNNRNNYKNLQINPEDVIEIWYPILHINPNFRSPSEVYHRLNNFEADLEEIKKRLGI